MYGYIFEVTNKKTGDTYLGKRYGVTFDKNYLGEEVNPALAVSIEKYGRPSFEARMIMPYETQEILDAVFKEMNEAKKKPVKKEVVKPVEVKVEEPKKEEPVKEVKKVPAKKGRKKATEEE